MDVHSPVLHIVEKYDILHCRNAHAIAIFLEGHEMVTKVLYPGLKSHPQHLLAKKQQHGHGAMVTFYCAGGREQCACILQNVRLFAACLCTEVL